MVSFSQNIPFPLAGEGNARSNNSGKTNYYIKKQKLKTIDSTLKVINSSGSSRFSRSSLI